MSPLPYAAPWWLPGGHLQTVYALYAPRPPVTYGRERWETPDGDFVDVDWLAPDECLRPPSVPHSSGGRHPPGASQTTQPAGSGPLIVLFHGLEGCSGSQYAHALMAEAEKRSWGAAVVNFRGCSGEANRLPRAYHSGDSAELDWMLRRLKASHDGPIYAVGVSLGGNVLLKWLGEQGDAAGNVISMAAAVSAPVDLTAVGDALARGFNRVYTRAFLSTLKAKSLAKLEHHPKLYDAALVRRARTLRAFDNVVTAPLHGFRDTDDYWTRASSKPWLHAIRVPTLILNARNDPFLPEEALPRPEEASSVVTLDFPREGGHVGFVSGSFPGSLSWLPQRVCAFFEETPQ